MSTADVGSWHDIGIWQVCFLVDSGSWHGTQEHTHTHTHVSICAVKCSEVSFTINREFVYQKVTDKCVRDLLTSEVGQGHHET